MVPLIWQGDTDNASPNYSGRYAFYQVPALPTAQFGGYLQDVGGGNPYPRYLNYYNQVVNQNSPLEITQFSTTIGDNLLITADVQVTSSITTSNNKILFILIRNQDSDYFCSVVSYDESQFNLTTVGQTETFETTIPVQSNWDVENLQTVVIVQSWQNKHVLQADIEPISLENMFSINAEFTALVSDNDQDGVINPGEDITMLLTVENTSLNIDAENVTGVFSTDNSYVTIAQPNLDFGELIDNGSAVTEEIVLQIDENSPLGDVNIALTVSAEYTDLYGNPGEFSYAFPLGINISLDQSGWPLATENQVESSPAVLDINGDGEKEIIFGEYGGLLHVVDIYGQELQGFPFDLGNDIWGSPAVVDLEQDGDIEIIIGSKNKHMFILNSDGSVQADYNAQQYIMGTPAVGNIDDDPDLEIVFGGYSSPGKLFAINADGTPVTGFPFELGEKIQRGVALADFNGNGKDDIVCGTDGETLVLIYDDLTIADGFPFEVGNDFRCAPSILDLNGEKIIFCGSRDDNFYAVNSDGTLRFQLQTEGDVASSPSFVNIGEEIGVFFGSDDGNLYGVDINGNALSGWPVDLGDDVETSPVFADVDGDDNPEVVVATAAGLLYVLNLDGTVFSHFPIENPYPFKGTATIVDMDMDGDLEIVAGSTGNVVAIDIKNSGSIENYWNVYRGSLKRTGFKTGTSGTEIQLEVNHLNGWNLVGLPLNVASSHYQDQFPAAIEGTLYSFDGAYVLEENLSPGVGYWLRMSSEGTDVLTGITINSVEIYLMEGWNLITGISNPIDAADIVDPSGIVVEGTLFQYSGSYNIAAIIQPGKGYWIRASESGTIQLIANRR
ncbi:MAG: hypothetical protein ISS10_03935 [Candidatus Marinimicrobia bacterium]|nr:hypothetical protein [Candidatus Neomarinimicrobiota bacterium]